MTSLIVVATPLVLDVQVAPLVDGDVKIFPEAPTATKVDPPKATAFSEVEPETELLAQVTPSVEVSVSPRELPSPTTTHLDPLLATPYAFFIFALIDLAVQVDPLVPGDVLTFPTLETEFLPHNTYRSEPLYAIS